MSLSFATHFAIGVPGWPVRMFVQTFNPANAYDQARDGEVVLPVEQQRPGCRISDDGRSVEWEVYGG